MKVSVLLVCLCCLSWRTDAQSQSYLITAPLSLHLDAMETVFLQLFGFTSEVSVYVFLKTSMAPDQKILSQDVVRLNSLNSFQGVANVRLFPNQVGSDVDHVVLHVQSDQINQHLSVPVSRTNGFLFIQTDKPLYTPHQKVKVRAFSMNQELRPANRSVFLTFKDPDQTPVDIVEMIDVNNGIPSMQNPFKIPIKPKLGIWTIEASYSDDFTTKAKTDFEVKEYVLPSFSILMEPQTNFISYQQFQDFSFKISARYLHGAPVAAGEAFLRYGYVSGTNAPTIIPSSVTRERLSEKGEVDVSLNMQEVLKKHDGPKDLNGLVGSYLYVAVLLQEDTGGITQEAEFAVVKFVRSPYSLSLISTPPFIKPGLPYNIKVLVKDHLGKPVNGVPVHLEEKQLVMERGGSGDMSCQDSGTSGSDGLVYFICSPLKNSARAVLKFKTMDPSLPAPSQASLSLEPVAYHSPNQRYLYIDTPMFDHSLSVGKYANIHVYSATPSYLHIKSLNYLVLSKGKVVFYRSVDFISSTDGKQTLNFLVTASMVPSIRLLVYYVLPGEGAIELVADSVWMDVKDNCVNGLQTSVSFQQQRYKPKGNIALDIRTNQDGLVALSAVDSALFTLRPNFRDPVSMVLRHIEQSDQGCGGGGGKNNADVFRLAGLTFMTNANAHSLPSSDPCTAAVRLKRALTNEQKAEKARTYGQLKVCCEEGMKYIPKSVTCEQYADQRFRKKKHVECKKVFKECCQFLQQHLDRYDGLVLGRNELGADFDLAPSLVRSYFPESWLWEVQRTRSNRLSVRKSLPDSLTTWQIKAIGMFQTGMCVAEPVDVSVSLPLSVDVPLPYQVVRGEQLELQGSVYNQEIDHITFCVTLTAGPALCLLKSEPTRGGAGLQSTPCVWSQLSPGAVAPVSFTLLGLEPGEHMLTFTLKTQSGPVDIVKKTLRVVPEGVRQEVNSGGTLDPQGIYGLDKMTVVLKNSLPQNIVPGSVVERLLTIHGDLPVEVVTVILKPEALKELINLPSGSAAAELERLLPLIQVYRYLETTGSWNLLGTDVDKLSSDLRQRIEDGQVAISSFRKGDSSYSMWIGSESSTMITAEMVRALALADSFVSVNHQSLSESVGWLIHRTQQPDGSFSEKSSFKHNKLMVEGADKVEQSVFVTSFVLIALRRATSIRDPMLQLQFHVASMKSAETYISRHALNVKSVYVRAVATYALTLHDPNSRAVSQLLSSLEGLARQKGNPVELRYWQEASVSADWLKPDESSGLTVETTAYVLLTVLLKGRIQYANPILTWLSQDQHYGEGFYSIKDTVLTLEALTDYMRIIPRTVLSQDINIRYNRKGALGQVQLSRSRPVATPIQITKSDDITVSTGYGRGVSSVKLKTVFYQTMASVQPRCNFDLTIEVVGPDDSNDPSRHLVACIKYKPPPNELSESTLTVMKIQLPTGVEPQMEDLRPFRDGEDPVVSHYELQGSTVIIQMDSVPSDIFLCVGFRVRTRFRVIGASESLLSVTEPQDRGSLCVKQFSDQEQKLQRLCVGEQCQCMTAACASYRGTIDSTLTADKRTEETCKPNIKYAYKVTVKSSAAEGDFMTYTATVDEVLKNSEEFEAVRVRTEVELVKKATCSGVDLQNNKQYLVMGSQGSEVNHNNQLKYRIPLDSEALVELWQTDCSSPECEDYIFQLKNFALDLQLLGCM
ncbi:complement C5 [Kryptolebias marmoratus]|uniref:complement C5 n=1 Tax=Kryptolebias marmoratus TaxID=37003 RepID=UPI0007F93F79|nr:complement C5 [Kryptolebias marmoratus]